ncbi:hypothetical protein D3260_10155 [Salinisphaera sp. Q1T1-3]|nr:hypothetical protein D3260_10155 [Salinisphaera sp. Q1T1-3]
MAIGHIGRDRIMLMALSEAAARHGARLIGRYEPGRRHQDDAPPACCRDCDVAADFARRLFENLCRRAGLANYAWLDGRRLSCG